MQQHNVDAVAGEWVKKAQTWRVGLCLIDTNKRPPNAFDRPTSAAEEAQVLSRRPTVIPSIVLHNNGSSHQPQAEANAALPLRLLDLVVYLLDGLRLAWRGQTRQDEVQYTRGRRTTTTENMDAGGGGHRHAKGEEYQSKPATEMQCNATQRNAHESSSCHQQSVSCWPKTKNLLYYTTY